MAMLWIAKDNTVSSMTCRSLVKQILLYYVYNVKNSGLTDIINDFEWLSSPKNFIMIFMIFFLWLKKKNNKTDNLKNLFCISKIKRGR